MSLPRPFSPQFGSNQVVVLAAATPQPISVTQDSTTLYVFNSGAGDLYVGAYSSKATAYVASNKDFAVPAGATRIIYVGDVMDRVSLFSVAGTTAQVMTGDGGI